VAVVVIDPGRDRARASALVANRWTERSSNSRVECQDSMPALSSADPARPIDCRIPIRSQAARNRCAVYSLPWMLPLCVKGFLAGSSTGDAVQVLGAVKPGRSLLGSTRLLTAPALRRAGW
jgi:hypothetical protein